MGGLLKMNMLITVLKNSFHCFLIILTLNFCTSVPKKLVQAAKQGDLAVINQIIHRSASVELKHLNYIVPVAAANNHKDVLELLIRAGANANTIGYGVETAEHKYDGTALFISAVNGYKDIIDFLIHSVGVDITIVGSFWQRSQGEWEKVLDHVSPLYVTAALNHRAIAEIFVREYKKSSNYQSDLMKAILVGAKKHHTRIVDLLIEAGIDPQKAYNELNRDPKNYNARELIKDRSRRKITILKKYHSIVDRCDILQEKNKKNAIEQEIQQNNTKLLDLAKQCASELKNVCKARQQEFLSPEGESRISNCLQKLPNCCDSCVIPDSLVTSTRCYSLQSLFL